MLVHSLKSISKTVGADDIFRLAKELEDAAKNDDDGYIELHNAELGELLKSKTTALKNIL